MSITNISDKIMTIGDVNNTGRFDINLNTSV